jgi:RHS repeat-associated protein
MIFDHPDEIGSATTATACTGNLVNEKLYYPFGEFWTGYALPNLGLHQEFAQLPDYDPETDQYNTANRHYSPSGRWMSPDPGGMKVVKLDDPQTWNMYAYVRNNPTTFTDPTGLYELNNSGCGDKSKCQKKWDKAASKFETRREKDLNSKKGGVRAAAAAYGDKGEANGVHVGFADLTSQRISGSVDPSGSTPGNPNVQATIDFGRAGSEETQTHEGIHVRDDLKFLNSYDPAYGAYDENLSITHGQTEFNAYKAGAEVNHEHGFGPNDTKKILDFLHNSPVYGPIFYAPVFNPITFPTGVPND